MEQEPTPDAPESPQDPPQASSSGWEPPGASEAGTKPSSEERTWAMVCHLSGVLTSTILPIVLPLVVYLVKKDESEFVGDQAKEALNFQITVILAGLAAAALTCVVIGFVILPVVIVGALILSIVAAIKSYEGENYRYPLTLRLI